MVELMKNLDHILWRKENIILIRQVNICKEHVVQASFINPIHVEILSHVFNNLINK